jgi:hypothetical protein
MLVAEVSDGENSTAISFPKKIPVKLKGNCTTELDFPPDDQQPSTSVTVTSSESDGNGNNNNDNESVALAAKSVIVNCLQKILAQNILD